MKPTVGQKATRSLTLGEEHVRTFAELTGDYNPLHFDESFAGATRFGRLVLHHAAGDGRGGWRRARNVADRRAEPADMEVIMRVGLSLWTGAVLVLASCERAAEPPAEAAGGLTEAEVVAIGDTAARTLTRELMGRVSAAIQEGGPAYAIEFCNERALPLTAAVADSLGVEIKRTSTRLRNPANAPDPLERQALEVFESELAAGRELPPHHIQRVDDGYRYYKPIVVAEFCTACHGPREALDPAVRQALDARYPADRATGYAPGDFRGVVRVTVPARGGEAADR